MVDSSARVILSQRTLLLSLLRLCPLRRGKREARSEPRSAHGQKYGIQSRSPTLLSVVAFDRAAPARGAASGCGLCRRRGLLEGSTVIVELRCVLQVSPASIRDSRTRYNLQGNLQAKGYSRSIKIQVRRVGRTVLTYTCQKHACFISEVTLRLRPARCRLPRRADPDRRRGPPRDRRPEAG